MFDVYANTSLSLSLSLSRYIYIYIYIYILVNHIHLNTNTQKYVFTRVHTKEDYEASSPALAYLNVDMKFSQNNILGEILTKKKIDFTKKKNSYKMLDFFSLSNRLIYIYIEREVYGSN